MASSCTWKGCTKTEYHEHGFYRKHDPCLAFETWMRRYMAAREQYSLMLHDLDAYRTSRNVDDVLEGLDELSSEKRGGGQKIGADEEPDLLKLNAGIDHQIRDMLHARQRAVEFANECERTDPSDVPPLPDRMRPGWPSGGPITDGRTGDNSRLRQDTQPN